MKQPIRYFSIGLLTASLIILIVVNFFDKPDNHVNEGSVDEMIATLKDKGYHVLSSSEYISLSVPAEPEEDQEEHDVDADETENNTTEEDSNEAQIEDEPEVEDADDTEVEETENVHEYTLTIEPNMLGPTISQLLNANNIIDDTDKFNRYLETEGYAPYLQLGEYELSSDMSHYEIAEKIAKKR